MYATIGLAEVLKYANSNLNRYILDCVVMSAAVLWVYHAGILQKSKECVAPGWI